MFGLVRSRAWSVLALLAGITSVLGGGCPLAATRLRCRVSDRDRAAAAAARAQHPQAHVRDLLDSVERRDHAVRWSCLLVSGELLRACHSWSLPALLAVLAGLWWLSGALKDADVVQLHARNLPGVPEEPADPPRWPYGWAGAGDLRVSGT